MSIVSGKRLKELRERAGKTQADIAQLLDITSQNVSAYERMREPSFDMLSVLARFYGVTTDYILGLSDYETSAQQETVESIDLIQSIPPQLRQASVGDLQAIKDFLITAQEYCSCGLPAKISPFILASNIMRYAIDHPAEDCTHGIAGYDEAYPVSFAAELFARDCIDSIAVKMEGYEGIVERRFKQNLIQKKKSEDNTHAQES